jgi:hypothetical protein
MVKGFCFSRTYLLIEFWSAFYMVRNANYNQLFCKNGQEETDKRKKQVSYSSKDKILTSLGKCMVADPHESVPDPPCHFDVDPNPTFTLMRILIRILLLIKMMQIFDHWHTDPPQLHFE